MPKTRSRLVLLESAAYTLPIVPYLRQPTEECDAVQLVLNVGLSDDQRQLGGILQLRLALTVQHRPGPVDRQAGNTASLMTSGILQLRLTLTVQHRPGPVDRQAGNTASLMTSGILQLHLTLTVQHRPGPVDRQAGNTASLMTSGILQLHQRYPAAPPDSDCAAPARSCGQTGW